MKKMFLKAICFVLTLLLLGNTLVACSTSRKSPADETGKSSDTTQASTSAAGEAATYPLKTDVTLTYWIPNSYLPKEITTQEDVPFLNDLQKKTGVKVKYQISTGTDVGQAFNLMLASGDLPDIIDYLIFSGGPVAGVNNGYIIKLNDVIDKWAPNYKKYLESRPDIDKMVKSDTGVHTGFPLIRGEPSLTTFWGPYLRKDWLDELGLQIPTTIDEWYTVLKAFKEKKGATAPLLLANDVASYFSSFILAYGVIGNMYQEDGKVKFGPAEPAYKDGVATLRKWYEEGLLDKSFATSDGPSRQASITTGKAGAIIGGVGGQMGTFIPAGRQNDPKYNLVAAPYPTLNKGDRPKFGIKASPVSQAGAAGISTKCKNVEVAARFLDYGYSEEGHVFFNFGTEGVSYTMVDGVPKYTDLILHNPDKKSIGEMMSFYIGAASRGSGYAQDLGYLNQYLSLPEQREAVKIWAETDAEKYLLPPVSLTEDESREYGKLITDINTYVAENTSKFILGATPMSDFDKYLTGLKKLNVDRAVEINQTALERYNKR